jgi:hypothetical protein
MGEACSHRKLPNTISGAPQMGISARVNLFIIKLVYRLDFIGELSLEEV